MSGLHGVETIELTTGTVAVQTISTAVIGLVGTAPDASGGVCASGTAGSWLLGTALDFTAKQEGRAGNKISVVAVAATEQNAQTVASLKGTTLTITLGTDEHSQVNATVARVTEVVNALGDSPVTAAASTLNAGGAENKVVSPFSLTLSGGEDEAFPVNTPVVVAGAITQAGKLGTAGTLYPALRDIFDQTGALVIVVRAESKTKAKEAEQRAAVIQAMEALTESKGVTGYQPRILIATGYSEDDGVAKALETYAAKLRAVAYIDSPSMATPQDVVQRRASFGGRVELLRPRVSVTDASGQTVFRPYSARAAGLRARIDYEKGWWWSKSNQDVMNITGLEQVDTFILGEQNCTANLLNMYLGAIYGQGKYVETCYHNQIYINRKLLEQRHISFSDVISRSKELLTQAAGVRNVTTSPYNPSVSGDLLIEVAPGWKLLNEDTQENYMVRAAFVPFPIIFYGAGIKAEHVSTPATVDRIAPTIAKAIRIRAPNACSVAPLQ